MDTMFLLLGTFLLLSVFNNAETSVQVVPGKNITRSAHVRILERICERNKLDFAYS
jgi:hypothetical protein